jgi:hypothetical protein
MNKEIKTHKELVKLHGKYVFCKYKGNTEIGRISVLNKGKRVYLCFDADYGAEAGTLLVHDTFGYTKARCISYHKGQGRYENARHLTTDIQVLDDMETSDFMPRLFNILEAYVNTENSHKEEERVTRHIVKYDETIFQNTIDEYEKDGYTCEGAPNITLEYPAHACVLYRKVDPTRKRTVYRITMSKLRTLTIKQQLLLDPRNELTSWNGRGNNKQIIRISPEYIEELLDLDYDIKTNNTLVNPKIQNNSISKSLFRTTLSMVNSLVFICKTNRFSFNYSKVLGNTERHYNVDTNKIENLIRKALRERR